MTAIAEAPSRVLISAPNHNSTTVVVTNLSSEQKNRLSVGCAAASIEARVQNGSLVVPRENITDILLLLRGMNVKAELNHDASALSSQTLSKLLKQNDVYRGVITYQVVGAKHKIRICSSINNQHNTNNVYSIIRACKEIIGKLSNKTLAISRFHEDYYRGPEELNAVVANIVSATASVVDEQWQTTEVRMESLAERFTAQSMLVTLPNKQKITVPFGTRHYLDRSISHDVAQGQRWLGGATMYRIVGDTECCWVVELYNKDQRLHGTTVQVPKATFDDHIDVAGIQLLEGYNVIKRRSLEEDRNADEKEAINLDVDEDVATPEQVDELKELGPTSDDGPGDGLNLNTPPISKPNYVSEADFENALDNALGWW